MKIILETKEGVVGMDPHNYIVADGVGVGKKGGEFFKNARYFGSLPFALDELRQVYQAKNLAKGEPAKSIAEFLVRIEKISENWFALIKKAELKGLEKGISNPV